MLGGKNRKVNTTFIRYILIPSEAAILSLTVVERVDDVYASSGSGGRRRGEAGGVYDRLRDSRAT